MSEDVDEERDNEIERRATSEGGGKCGRCFTDGRVKGPWILFSSFSFTNGMNES